MYYLSSILVVIILFGFIALAIEAGYRIGIKRHEKIDNLSKSQINAFTASTIGMLALSLGFTFSVSLRHYDLREEAVVHEANAIGTAYLRADLLPTEIRGEATTLLRNYLDVRINSGEGSIEGGEQKETPRNQAANKLDELWALAMQAAEVDAGPVKSGLFIQSMNELIDSYGKLSAANTRHVPVPIFVILFSTFILSGGVVGFASGVEKHRVPTVAYVLVLIIVLIVFATFDLDRPRGGLIKVSQECLTNLQASLK